MIDNWYADNLLSYTNKIDDVVLSSSVKENCDTFKGKYFNNNGYTVNMIINHILIIFFLQQKKY